MNGGDAHLFVYGTLRDAAVQRAVFGREVEGEADAVRGYRLVAVTIDGTAYSSLARCQPSEAPVHGLVLQLSEDELARADAYEGSTDYVRAVVSLESGRIAFVYLSRDG